MQCFTMWFYEQIELKCKTWCKCKYKCDQVSGVESEAVNTAKDVSTTFSEDEHCVETAVKCKNKNPRDTLI